MLIFLKKIDKTQDLKAQFAQKTTLNSKLLFFFPKNFAERKKEKMKTKSLTLYHKKVWEKLKQYKN